MSSRKVLVIPDKFKGTLTAHEAAAAIARGWSKRFPTDALELLPMSDGGDGFGEVMGSLVGAEPRKTNSVDAAHRHLEATWWWQPHTQLAIVESARVIGLAQLPTGKFHPFDLDTAGLGTLLRAIKQEGARGCLVGIGGSATNDAGFGMATALGWRFLDRNGTPISQWNRLRELARVEPPGQTLRFDEVIVAVDVQNPLLGPTGCSRVYGPQKGLRPEDFEPAEKALGRLAEVLDAQLQLHAAELPGAGAAGGLGYGLVAFLGARFKPGFDLFAEHARLEERLKAVQLVLTGEGSIDESTLMGKGVGEVARRCQVSRVPCYGLCGRTTHRAGTQTLFTDIAAMCPELASAEEALSRPAYWLEKLAEQKARSWGL